MRKALLVTLVLSLFVGCGREEDTRESDVRSTAETKPLALEVDPVSRDVTTEQAVTIRGRVTPGSRVTVGTTEARVSEGRFRARVRLEPGANPIAVTARRPGYREERERLRIKRTEPPPVAAPSPQPNVNPNCPPGMEPNTTGGCEVYDEQDGQVEPKINDPRCYSNRPPAGCF